ncbi:MAG: hypothetical protein QOD67_160, partial [Caballeronia sp.]|nr:hypothetical protein [Caballeronia sp.]
MCSGRWFAVLFMRSPMRWFYSFTAVVLRAGFMRLKVNAVKTSGFLGDAATFVDTSAAQM